MKRNTHQLVQGAPDWLAHRARIFNASEAPAVMGASKYQTRSALLQQKATGIAPEVDAGTQRLFDRGHAVEAPTVALIEQDIGDSLAPVVATMEIEGMTLGASYDGLTLLEDAGAEIKLWNEDLARQIRAGDIEPHYFWQLEQQFIVTPSLERIIFATSDGTRERFVSMEYRPMPGRRELLLAAWKQFAEDLAAYTPAAAADPVPTGRAPEALPALRIEVTGQVTASNLGEFKTRALAVFGGINRDLKTDADFADAEKTVKWCSDVEQRLAAAKQHALSQTASIDALFTAVDEISAEARKVRLDLEKLVKARKEAIRGEIVARGIEALRKHILALNERLGGAYMPIIPADFGGAVKGLRTVASVQNAVDTELARAKIAASEAADRVEANMKALSVQPAHLFRDLTTLVHKAPDDLQAVIAARLAEEERRQNAERERIRKEEAERADREAAARAEAARAAATPQATQPPAPAANEAPAVSSNAGNVRPLQRPTPAPAAPPSLRLGQINERIAPLTLTAEGLRTLGFEPAGRERAAVLYHDADFLPIVRAAIAHLEDVADQRAAA